MSDRYNGFTVALEKEVRDDDAEYIINAIKMIKGVSAVTPNVVDINTFVAHSKVSRECGEILLALIKQLNNKY